MRFKNVLFLTQNSLCGQLESFVSLISLAGPTIAEERNLWTCLVRSFCLGWVSWEYSPKMWAALRARGLEWKNWNEKRRKRAEQYSSLCFLTECTVTADLRPLPPLISLYDRQHTQTVRQNTPLLLQASFVRCFSLATRTITNWSRY